MKDLRSLALEDPLHEILERHLYRASTEGENAEDMVNAVITDYLLFLDSQGVHIPGPMKAATVEDLKEEIRTLVVKKTHGSVAININQSQINLNVPKRRVV